MNVNIKRNVYRTGVRPALMYRVETLGIEGGTGK